MSGLNRDKAKLRNKPAIDSRTESASRYRDRAAGWLARNDPEQSKPKGKRWRRKS